MKNSTIAAAVLIPIIAVASGFATYYGLKYLYTWTQERGGTNNGGTTPQPYPPNTPSYNSPAISVTVQPPSIMYFGYDYTFDVTITNTGGAGYVDVTTHSTEQHYQFYLDTGETKTLQISQCVDDLGDGTSDVYHNLSIEVNASNDHGSDTKNRFVQVRVEQEPVDVWYSSIEIEGKQSFWTTFRDIFTFIGGYERYVEETSLSVCRMVHQLSRHENSILNLKEIYYFVRDCIPYDYDKWGEWYLGIDQATGFGVQYPAETLKLQKGICLDKALLLASMLEAAGYDATLVYTQKGRDGHVFTAVYLPGYPRDHLNMQVPYGSWQDWLCLDAVSRGIQFGEDWTYEASWGSYEMVDVGTEAVTPSVQVVDAYWVINNNIANTATLRDDTRARVSLIAVGGSITKSVELHVWKDISFWFDQDFAVQTFAVNISHSGEIQTIEMSFTPDEASGGLTQGYYIQVDVDSAQIYQMEDGYPPRLRVTS